jgi:DNA-binding response OmpR family regulator
MYPTSGRVLVVDDEPHLREMLRDFLAGEGHDVMMAASGAEALDAAPTFRPDVILLDMSMPGMSGTEVVDALRRIGLTMPVVVLSGAPQPPGEEFFGTLIKPFNLRELAATVAAAIIFRRSSSA